MPYAAKSERNRLARENYHKNREKYIRRSKAQRERAKKHIWSIKEKSICKECGEDHPATLDFHHKDPNEKEITANAMIKMKWSIDNINRELAKCDILCSNCHRKFHHSLD